MMKLNRQGKRSPIEQLVTKRENVAIYMRLPKEVYVALEKERKKYIKGREDKDQQKLITNGLKINF